MTTQVTLVTEDFENNYFKPDDCPMSRAIKRLLGVDYVYCTRDSAYADQTKHKLLATFESPYSRLLNSVDERLASSYPKSSLIRTHVINIQPFTK